MISWPLDHPTVIGQATADTALAYSCVAGPDLLDDAGFRESFARVTADISPMAPRIGWVTNSFPDRRQPVMLQQIEAAVGRLRAAGGEIVDIDLPDGWDVVWPVSSVLAGAERTTFHARYAGELCARGVDAPWTWRRWSRRRRTGAQRVRRWLLGSVMPLLDQVDVPLAPATVAEPPPGHDSGDRVHEQSVGALGTPALTFNFGLSPKGPPMGAPPCLAGALLRAALGGFTDPFLKVAGEDATVVVRSKAAGGLLLGKLFMTCPGAHQPSRNPWNAAHTLSGSSSGSTVGGRYVSLTLSEQTGGSGTRPGGYSGISALGPTYGRTSMYGMSPTTAFSRDPAHIIATDIAEVERIFAVTAGQDPKNPSSRSTLRTEARGSCRVPRRSLRCGVSSRGCRTRR